MDAAHSFQGRVKERVSSTIQFPYTDMSDALAVAEGMLKGGGVALSRDQLAAAMGLAPGGGGFATKVATARLFGVLEPSNGKYELTDLGHEIVDPSRQADAKVRAFLNVELFKRTYEEFKNRLLPPRPLGIEAAFVKFGVSQKTVKTARLAFEKSARMAGFFPTQAEDRLVMPFGAPSVGPAPVQDEAPQNPEQNRSDNDARQRLSFELHPAIEGLLEELPAPKAQWSRREQADWLDALATVFRVVYKDNGQGKLSVVYAENGSSGNRDD
jgi:hypothetical protein